jgi:hypothetical protein
MDIRQLVNTAKAEQDHDAQRAAEYLLRERQLTDHSLGEVLALGRAIHEGMTAAAMGVPHELAWADYTALASTLLAQYAPDVQRGILGQAIYVAEGGWNRSEALVWALDAAGILPTADHPARWHEYRAGAGERMRRLHEVIAAARAGNLQQRLAL